MEEENKNSEKANEWKKRELGALWKKEGKNQNYFSGKINVENFKDSSSINIVGFTNKNKKDKVSAPDVILYASSSSNESSNSLDLNSSKDETPNI
jgi:hypothetical protein